MARVRSFFVISIFPALRAGACTVCNSTAGHQVRAGIFDGHFLHTAAIVGAPIPVFAAALFLLHVLMPNLPSARSAVQFGKLREAEPAR